MRKKSLCVLILCLLLTACSAPGHGVGEVISGGEEIISPYLSADLAEAALSAKGKKETITLSFSAVWGSETGEIGAPPFYFIRQLEAPWRLYLSFEGLYTITADVEAQLAGSGLVKGAFVKAPGESGITALTVQLSSPCTFAVEEDGAALKLTLTPAKAEGDRAWYVIVDAFEAYETDDRPFRRAGLYPTQAADGERIVLISAPYESRQAAEETAQAFDGARVIELQLGQLPEIG